MLWFATDPGLAVAEFKRQAQTERADDDAARIAAALDEAAEQERNLIESLMRLTGPAKLGVEGRLQEVADYRAGLQARLDELELQRLTLERRGQAVVDRLSIWSAEIERVKELTFAERRDWLRRLGTEVTVAKHGGDLPRYEIAFNIPVEIAETLRGDPDGEFAPWTPDDDADYARWVSLYERPEPLPESDPIPTPDMLPLSRYAGSIPSGPSFPAPCAIQGQVVVRWYSERCSSDR